jgi:hypothetical protein
MIFDHVWKYFIILAEHMLPEFRDASKHPTMHSKAPKNKE